MKDDVMLRPGIVGYLALASLLALVLGVSQQVVLLHAQTTAIAALQKAKVSERLAEALPQAKGQAPSFVVDPAWPKPLPHNWIIGDIGGLFVDKQDHIWVYHRPRSLSSTDSGAQSVAGKDDKGNPISALGFPRPYGQIGRAHV